VLSALLLVPVPAYAYINYTWDPILTSGSGLGWTFSASGTHNELLTIFPVAGGGTGNASITITGTATDDGGASSNGRFISETAQLPHFFGGSYPNPCLETILGTLGVGGGAGLTGDEKLAITILTGANTTNTTILDLTGSNQFSSTNQPDTF